MRYLDWACAWMILLGGVAHILHTEINHPRGAVLDTGLLLITLAMLNILRLRNGYGVKGLKTFCIGANIGELILGLVGWKMFGPPALVGVILFFGETLFSIKQKS
jgi:hypothetical protein